MNKTQNKKVRKKEDSLKRIMGNKNLENDWLKLFLV